MRVRSDELLQGQERKRRLPHNKDVCSASRPALHKVFQQRGLNQAGKLKISRRFDRHWFIPSGSPDLQQLPLAASAASAASAAQARHAAAHWTGRSLRSLEVCCPRNGVLFRSSSHLSRKVQSASERCLEALAQLIPLLLARAKGLEISCNRAPCTRNEHAQTRAPESQLGLLAWRSLGP